jgi:hypothetical protein
LLPVLRYLRWRYRATADRRANTNIVQTDITLTVALPYALVSFSNA